MPSGLSESLLGRPCSKYLGLLFQAQEQLPRGYLRTPWAGCRDWGRGRGEALAPWPEQWLPAPNRLPSVGMKRPGRSFWQGRTSDGKNRLNKEERAF